MTSRRTLLMAAGAAATLTTAGVKAQSPVISTKLRDQLDGTVADCTVLRQIDQRLAAEAARSLTMSSADLGKEVVQINSMLKNREGVVRKIAAALSAARKDLALEAVGGAIDIAIQGCTLTHNPVLIGSALGIKVVADTAIVSVQLYNAQTTERKVEVLTAYGKSRLLMISEFPAALWPADKNAQILAIVTKAVDVTHRLSEAGAAVSQLQAELQKVSDDLKALDKAYAKALVNDATYRQFRQQDFEGQRWFVQLLMSAAGPHCRIDSMIKP